jgi:hypothetical protein
MIDDVRVQMQQQDWGLELVFGTIGSISPSQDVIQKRVDDWKARRESELDTLEAEAAAVEIHWTEQARATAHVELFRTIIEGLDLAAKLQPEDTRKLMAFQLLEAIERLGTSDPDLADRDTSAIRVIRRRLQ